MSQRNLVLGSVASLALVGAVIGTAPGLAQSLPRYPTPAEQAQTDALNAQQASEPGIVVATTVPDAASTKAYNDALAQQNAAQNQYGSQLKDYQDKTSAYEKQKQDYQARVDAYKGQANVYHDEQSAYADQSSVYGANARTFEDLATAPAVVVPADPPTVIVPADPPAVVVPAEPSRRVLLYPDEPSRLVPFHQLVDPDAEIAGAPVAALDGEVVGHFRHLTFQDEGREKAVITLHNNKSIAVPDEHLRFDPATATVVADLSYDELARMPARF